MTFDDMKNTVMPRANAQRRFMDRARKALTTPPPRLHPQSWDALRSLARLHGVEALLAALRHIEGDRT